MKRGFVYMMANRKNGVIYTGVTSELIKRTYDHREGLIDGFTKRYGCKLLVWFEAHDDLQEARKRELQKVAMGKVFHRFNSIYQRLSKRHHRS